MSELHKSIQIARSVHDRNDGPADSTAVILGALIRAVERLAERQCDCLTCAEHRAEGPPAEGDPRPAWQAWGQSVGATDTPQETSTNPTAAFSDELVERLGHVVQRMPPFKERHTWNEVADVVRAILTELAKGPSALPTHSELLKIYRDETSPLCAAIEIERLYVASVAPVLAAKDAENKRLTEWNCKHTETIEQLQAKVTELDSAVAIERSACAAMNKVLSVKDSDNEQLSTRLIECRRLLATRVEAVRLDAANKRIAELEKEVENKTRERMRATSNLDDAKEDLRRANSEIVILTDRVAELEKRLAGQTAPPIDGKTPGQVVYEGFPESAILGSADPWCEYPKELQSAWQVAAQAVLDTFGRQQTREALERVRDKLGSEAFPIDNDKGYMVVNGDLMLNVVEAELAKLGQDKPTSDHVQAPKKYARDWLLAQTDDALFDLYMQHVGFFDMNGSMVERENMIEMLASIGEQ